MAVFPFSETEQGPDGGGAAGLTGGLLEDSGLGYYPPAYDRCNTLSAGLMSLLPRRAWAATIEYGSGFLNGDGPAHLPPHAREGLSFGETYGESWLLALNPLNLANRRYPLDSSNTFGGTHYGNPPEVYVQMRCRFHFFQAFPWGLTFQTGSLIHA